MEQWSENCYYQYFGGEKIFACGAPCEASELVHFRNRIGEEGIELIFKESIRINGKDGQEQEATTDTTVQEKNITYPTDNKLYHYSMHISPIMLITISYISIGLMYNEYICVY